MSFYFFFLTTPHPLRSTLFPYTTLFRSQRGVGFSGIVSIGDQLDVDLADLLDHFALDGGTRAILLYIEAVKDARKFMSAARGADRKSTRLNSSHTVISYAVFCLKKKNRT